MTPEEYNAQLLAAIKTIKAHCYRFLNCKGCAFDDEWLVCPFSHYVPCDWEIERLDELLAKNTKKEATQ